MDKGILVLNAGSSSVKFAVYGREAIDRPLLRGLIEGVGGDHPVFLARGEAGQSLEAPVLNRPPGSLYGHGPALADLLAWLEHRPGLPEVVAVGHRVVHGGREFAAPVRITSEVLAQLEDLSSLAPLHQPHNLAPVKVLLAQRPELAQVACFDTAFHRTQPVEERMFALPRSLWQQGVERYGFHGLSYEHIARRLPDLDGRQGSPGQPRRLVAAHLGSGASLCALQDLGQGYRSQGTSMGFTALDGLMMGTRCGSLDPGVVLHLIRHEGLSPARVEQMLYKESGLLGVSGISNDMRELLASDAPQAQEAIALFVHRILRETGALAAAMGGLDGVVFTGGIGERSAPIRAAVCQGLEWLGLRLDPAANQQGTGPIHAPDSRLGAYVIPADEEGVIASHTRQRCQGELLPQSALAE